MKAFTFLISKETLKQGWDLNVVWPPKQDICRPSHWVYPDGRWRFSSCRSTTDSRFTRCSKTGAVSASKAARSSQVNRYRFFIFWLVCFHSVISVTQCVFWHATCSSINCIRHSSYAIIEENSSIFNMNHQIDDSSAGLKSFVVFLWICLKQTFTNNFLNWYSTDLYVCTVTNAFCHSQQEKQSQPCLNYTSNIKYSILLCHAMLG